MWNQSKSLWLTSIWVKVAFAVWIALVCAMTIFCVFAWEKIYNGYGILLILFYGFSIAICHIFLCLNKLLTNIKAGLVFDNDNVKQLRSVSWSCFWGALILIAGSLFYVEVIFLAGIMGFFGLLLRVIKNVFSDAIALKHENDFMI